jgi:hypothetical protein
VVGVSTEPRLVVDSSRVVRAQRFVTQSLRKTLVGLASTLMVVGVAPV